MKVLESASLFILSGGDFKNFPFSNYTIVELYCVFLLQPTLPKQVQKKLDSISQSQPSIIIKGRISVGLTEAAVSEGVIVSEFNLSRNSMLLAAFY